MYFKNLRLLFLLMLISTQSLRAMVTDDALFKISFSTIGSIDVTGYKDIGTQANGLANQSEEEQLFLNYWSVKDVNEYKALFYNGEFPLIDEELFGKWRSSVHVSASDIRGKVNFTIGGNAYCIIPNGKSDGMARQSFMMKNIGGRWYPVSSEENIQFKEIRDFFMYARPEALASLMEIRKSEAGISTFTYDNLKQKYKRNNVLQGSALLSDIEAASKHRSTVKSESVLALTYLYNPATSGMVLRKAPSENDQKMLAYLNSLGISPSDADKVMEMIHSGAYTGSAIMIQELLNEVSAKPYAMKIREIYGEDKIRIFNSVEGKWR
jgi:hypothetical protein